MILSINHYSYDILTYLKCAHSGKLLSPAPVQLPVHRGASTNLSVSGCSLDNCLGIVPIMIEPVHPSRRLDEQPRPRLYPVDGQGRHWNLDEAGYVIAETWIVRVPAGNHAWSLSRHEVPNPACADDRALTPDNPRASSPSPFVSAGPARRKFQKLADHFSPLGTTASGGRHHDFRNSENGLRNLNP